MPAIGSFQKLLAALAAAAVCTSLASCSDCKSMKANGSAVSGPICGGEGTDAPEPPPVVPSACQPRAVMPNFFKLLDNSDAALAGVRSVVKDLGTPVCQVTPAACASDDQCQIGSCINGACPCTAEYSPLANILGFTFGGLATIANPATNPPEPGSVGTPGCLSATGAANLPPEKRNRICELRRALDVLLQQNGGQKLLDDPNVHRVTVALLDYLQGKPPFTAPHYDLITGIGRIAGADPGVCDPAAGWSLLDNLLGSLSPALAQQQLAAIQTLLADPTTKEFLRTFSQGGGSANGRQSVIVLVHALTPSLLAAMSGNDALTTLQPVLDQIDNGSFPQTFKAEVHAVVGNTAWLLGSPAWAGFARYAMNARVVNGGNLYQGSVTCTSAASGGPASTGAGIVDGTCRWNYLSASTPAPAILPPLQKVIACAGSAAVRCADPVNCNKDDDELLGAAYDLISLPETSGGIDLSTLVGALNKLVTLDSTGQTARTIRLVVEGIKGSDDPTEPHEVRDAVAALARQALTASEAQKLVPAVEVLIDRHLVTEIFSLLQDLLYQCTPPQPPGTSK